jgi:putative flippase GtrA
MPLISRYYDSFRQYLASHFSNVYKFCNQHKSIVKFIVAGCLATGTDLLLLYIFHGVVHLGLVLSTSLAFILAFLISFSLQKFWTFRNYRPDKMAGQLCWYMLNALLGLYLNAVAMHTLVNKFQVWYLLSQVIVNLLLGVWNFLVYKFIIFTDRP